MDSGTGHRPLERLRILDLTHVLAGPFCVNVLADAGAEVIKVEPPGQGEIRRQRGSSVPGSNDQPIGAYFAVLARSRKGITLNFKHPAGKALLIELARVADVLVVNFSPGTMERLGLGYDVLRRENPGLVYAAISGFGQLPPYLGPYTEWQANNATAQAMSGLMDLTRDRETEGPPMLVGASVGDTIPALYAVIGILLALEERRRTGLGQFVDVAMYDCVTSLAAISALANYVVTGQTALAARAGAVTRYGGVVTRYTCGDGYVAVSMQGGPEKWERFLRAIGRPEIYHQPDFDPRAPGKSLEEVLRPAIEGWAADKSKWEVTRLFLECEFSCGPVQNMGEIATCPQLAAREMVVEIDDRAGGRIKTVGFPLKFSDMPLPVYGAPPRLGEHTREVVCDILGHSAEEFATLQREGAV
ncbi:MAG: CoA transferase [Chloroflexi bacterium]|nr:CoA transferase [Chloroflexota bacterium]